MTGSEYSSPLYTEDYLFPRTDRKVLNIAHRGARSLAPENTLAAANKALEVGADAWELDVCMTADGELVVHHDDTLMRTSNAREVFPSRAPWNIRDFTLQELRRLDFGTWFVKIDPFMTVAAGDVSWSEAQDYIGEPIPTLREALAFTRDNDWQVYIELKDQGDLCPPEILVERVINLVREMGVADRVLISSFNHDYLVHSRALDPSVATGALVECSTPAPYSVVCKLKGHSYHPHVSALKAEDFIALREEGMEIVVWTVNEGTTMRRLIESGATGIITDFPQLLRAILAQDQTSPQTL